MTLTTKEAHREIKVKSLEEIKPYYNRVLCKSLYNNLDNRTAGGIWVASEFYNRDQYLAKNVNRIFRVIKNPVKLDCYDWECDIETQEGDTIWIAHTDALRCPIVLIGGKAPFHLINYYDIKLIKREEHYFNYEEFGKNGYLIEDDITYRIIPTNGYVICEEVKEKIKGLAYEKEAVNLNYGIVRYLGKPNRGYNRVVDGEWKFIDMDGGREKIKPKDKVHISDIRKRVMLETDIHSRFGDKGKNYFVVQRRFIDAIVKD